MARAKSAVSFNFDEGKRRRFGSVELTQYPGIGVELSSAGVVNQSVAVDTATSIHLE
jgi:hypothetical protein